MKRVDRVSVFEDDTSMSTVKRSIETEGMIDKSHRLVVSERFPVRGPRKVRVIVFFDEEEEIPQENWLQAAEAGGSFDFLSEEGEDLYDERDGESLS